MTKVPFYSSCVTWPKYRIWLLQELIGRAREITRKTFVANVDSGSREELEQDLGYGPEFPISRDAYVTYLWVPGYRIYMLVHSSIEYIFASQEEVSRFRERALRG